MSGLNLLFQNVSYEIYRCILGPIKGYLGNKLTGCQNLLFQNFSYENLNKKLYNIEMGFTRVG